MPNCDFYATPEDHAELLTWLFAERRCDVYELASDFEQSLQQFHDVDQVLAQFEKIYPTGKKWTSVTLQLYVHGAGPRFIPRRVSLDPKACGGATFRFAAEGWGLVQLYLQAPRADGLENSHTNHNSRRRAENWAPVAPAEPSPDLWDFERITSFSSRLNRQIRKQAVAKIGSRVVHPGAVKVWDAGLRLWPYEPGQAALEMLA